MLSVNDERATVLGRVWNYPANRGLMLGQKIQILIDDILAFLFKDLNVIYQYMFAEITKPIINGTRMTAIFYDDEQIPIKTVRCGASCFDDYTVPRSRSRWKGQIH